MALIAEQISNLINGVSQQPPALRLASQAAIQENGLSTIAEGLKKRPPLEYVAKLNNKTIFSPRRKLSKIYYTLFNCY